jgi:hypothetical protein
MSAEFNSGSPDVLQEMSLDMDLGEVSYLITKCIDANSCVLNVSKLAFVVRCSDAQIAEILEGKVCFDVVTRCILVSEKSNVVPLIFNLIQINHQPELTFMLPYCLSVGAMSDAFERYSNQQGSQLILLGETRRELIQNSDSKSNKVAHRLRSKVSTLNCNLSIPDFIDKLKTMIGTTRRQELWSVHYNQPVFTSVRSLT